MDIPCVHGRTKHEDSETNSSVPSVAREMVKSGTLVNMEESNMKMARPYQVLQVLNEK